MICDIPGVGARTQVGLTVGQLGEAALLRKIQALTAKMAPGVVGLDDDGCVLGGPGQVVASTDMLIEDRDFRFSWASWADVGHKAAAANLSDLAAMGADPQGLLLSLALPSRTRVRDVMNGIRSFARLGARFGAPLVGGDLSDTGGPAVWSVTALGRLQGKPLRRGHARLGDVIAVTGTVGDAAAGLWALENGCSGWAGLKRRQTRPLPQLEAGRLLRGIARSGVDVSDGLAIDAAKLVPHRCSVCFEPEALPVSAAARRLAKVAGVTSEQWGFAGGEDFELVVAVAPRRFDVAVRRLGTLGIRLTRVGVVVSGNGSSLPPSGYEHWRDLT